MGGKTIHKAIQELDIKQPLTETFRQLGTVKSTIQLENDKYTFTLSKTLKPRIETAGIDNRCGDGLFIFFADYDRVYLDIVKQNLRVLLERFPGRFENFYIAASEQPREIEGKTFGNFHIVSFAKMPKLELAECLGFCDIDPQFKEALTSTAHRANVLRSCEKVWIADGKQAKERPFFLEHYPLEPANKGLISSLAHYMHFVHEAWAINDLQEDARTFDNSQQVTLHFYKTAKVPGGRHA